MTSKKHTFLDMIYTRLTKMSVPISGVFLSKQNRNLRERDRETERKTKTERQREKEYIDKKTLVRIYTFF